MIENSNIDLTENSDFSKSNPLVVHVKGNTINHPRIPWKINKEKSYLNSFYNKDGDFNYSQPIHFTLSTINNSSDHRWNSWQINSNYIYNPYSELNDWTNNFSGTYNIISNTNNYTITRNHDDILDSISYSIQIDGIYEKEITDIFGLKRKVSLFKSITPRIPSEFKRNDHSINYKLDKLPKIFRKIIINSDKYYSAPEELYGRENNIFSNRQYYRNRFMSKRIPWRDFYNKFIRVGKRTSERGIVYYN